MNLNNRYSTLFLVAFSWLQFSCSSSSGGGENVQQQQSKISPDKEVEELAEENLEKAAAQYKVLMERLPEGRFPKTYYAENDSLETSDSGWWVSGFYPGTLLYLYEETGDEVLLTEAKRIMTVLEKEKFNTETHDLGFMMFDSFGNAYRLNPSDEYKDIIIQSAKSLVTRYNPKVGAIRSWNSKPEDFLVIIDNMMNLDMLFWATEQTGDSTYYNIAVEHANTTMENHFREDNSTYHVLNYDPETGNVQEKKTAQGYADESAWARGQAWGLYGFIDVYRETGDEKYLEQAKKIAEFILNHPNMPEDKIPYWDFNAPNIPNAPRDASTAAIMASALLELSEYVEGEKAEQYFNNAEQIIRTLSTPEYLAAPGTNGGFILKHSVGSLPANSEVDVPLTYGDYYYVEALKRYLEYGKEGSAEVPE
ncbi:glycoside hydrolase family 88 protein [Pontibacter toksunensis]|uniref:Glycoside hydrolase family 88 protein n=1 Tax=Pontibacter toksunensis TaxID=1332631 RepID=A0ABW6BVY6_9BACT